MTGAVDRFYRMLIELDNEGRPHPATVTLGESEYDELVSNCLGFIPLGRSPFRFCGVEVRLEEKRKPWAEYFFDLAELAASRSTCPRKQVGAVIVKHHRVLSTGYNGSIPGGEHCEDVGCLIENDHCKRTLHAEANAIAQAARFGTAIEGASIYVTVTPCADCQKLIHASGMNFYNREDYP
jgi:dCMP deaminase